MNCPLCDTPLGPVLKGAYAHFPDARFCTKCVRFVELTAEELKQEASEKETWKP